MQIIKSQFTFIFILLSLIIFNVGFNEGRGFLICLLPGIIPFIFKNSVIRLAAIVINFFLIPVLLMEMGHAVLFETLSTPGVFIAVLESDWKESLEFIQSQNMAFLIITLLLSIFVLLLSFKKFPSLKKSYIIIIAILILFISLGQTIHKSPIRLISYFQMYLAEKNDFRDRLSMLPNSAIQILRASSMNKNTIVFILGESTTRNRMSLYGYGRSTTPLLEKMKGLSVLRNIVSPHSQTYRSLRKVLTLLNHENEGKIFSNIHIINLAKAAGYKTYWISNQSQLGKFETPHSIMAASAHEVHWLKTTLSDEQDDFDERTIPALKRVLKKSDVKKFIVIHLMGAHALYKNRYPSEFAKFNGMKNDLSDFQSATYNEYDNSILYQDYVLTNLFQTIRDNEKFFSAIYFPDHGEEVFQAAQFSGHTEAKQTINMFEIPMLFDSTSDKLNLIAKRRAYELWSIEDFIHSLHGLLDVETQYYDDKRDFFSPAYKEIPRKTGKSIYQVQKK